MNLLPTQQSIVAQLQSTFTNMGLPFTAMDYPEADRDVLKALDTPLIFVGYRGSASDQVLSTNPVYQQRTLRFFVAVYARKFYGPNGLFVARDIVEQAIIGFEPTNAQRLYLKKDDLTDTEDNIWAHMYELECVTALVQQELTENEIAASFTGLKED